MNIFDGLFGASQGYVIGAEAEKVTAVLTHSMLLRSFIKVLYHIMEPKTLEPGIVEPNVIMGDLVQRHVSFELSDLTKSLDDVVEHEMMPHVYGLAAILKMSRAWQVFELPMPPNWIAACRHSYSGISLRMIVEEPKKFRIDILFRPRPSHIDGIPVIDIPRITDDLRRDKSI